MYKIICMAFYRQDDGWDTEHMRATDEMIAKLPKADKLEGLMSSESYITAVWTDEEYEAKWGKSFIDGGYVYGLPHALNACDV